VRPRESDDAIPLTDFADDITLCDEEIIDPDKKDAHESDDAIPLTDFADDPDFDEEKNGPPSDSGVERLVLLTNSDDNGEKIIELVSKEKVLSEDIDEIIELTASVTNAFENDDTVNIAPKKEKMTEEDEILELTELATDIFEDAYGKEEVSLTEEVDEITGLPDTIFENEDTNIAKEKVLSDELDEVIELEDLAVHVSDNEETAIDRKEKALLNEILELTTPLVDEEVLSDEVPELTDSLTDKKVLLDEILELTYPLADTFDDGRQAGPVEKETALSEDAGENVLSADGERNVIEFAAPRQELSDLLIADSESSADVFGLFSENETFLPEESEKNVFRLFSEEKSGKDGLSDSEETLLSEESGFPEESEKILLFQDRKKKAGFGMPVIKRAENTSGKTGHSDEESDPQQEEDLLDLMDMAIEQEVGSLFESSDDVFSENDIVSESQENALEEKSGNMEVFLEHIIKKIVSEKIDDMIIDERRVIDVIGKAVTKERNRLIKELTRGG
ncbi:hypothetical protein QUF72_09460, partial [Desulfobacterales bacterium HSG2]|nr:hypothetical protein [Desulfobacterales bacterium HSG2]